MTTSARQLMQWIDKKVFVRFENIEVPCTVLDVRQVWNRTDVFIQADGGKGQQWISTERVVKYQ